MGKIKNSPAKPTKSRAGSRLNSWFAWREKSKFVLCVLLLFSALCLCMRGSAIAQDKIAAIVNQDVITQKDLSDFLNFMRVQLTGQYNQEGLEKKIDSIKPDLLNKLIEDRLISQDAKKNNLKIDENRVKARIDEIRVRFASENEFQQALKQQGLVQADLEQKTREQMLMFEAVDEKIKKKILITPSEVTDFYELHARDLKIPEEREFQVIATEEQNLADQILSDSKQEADFSSVAQKYSLEAKKMTAAKNGELKKEFEDAVFALNKDEVSQPVKIDEKFYIFKLDAILPPKQLTLADAQERIYTLLFESKMQEALTKWLDELKKKSYIKIMQD